MPKKPTPPSSKTTQKSSPKTASAASREKREEDDILILEDLAVLGGLFNEQSQQAIELTALVLEHSPQPDFTEPNVMAVFRRARQALMESSPLREWINFPDMATEEEADEPTEFMEPEGGF